MQESRISEEPKYHCAETYVDPESKNVNVETKIMSPSPSMMHRAQRAYESFHRLPAGSSSEAQVARSSAGVEGWLTFAGILEARSGGRDDVVRSGSLKGMVCSSSTEARLVEQLSSQNAGFRVNGTNDDSTETIESMIDHVGRPLKSTLCLCEGDAPQQSILVNDAEWIDVEFEVALDSGSTDHVCHSGDVPGYVVEASPGSRAGQGFIVGNGARVPNDGQAVLNLQATNKNTMATTFQLAKVSRPLMSVGRLCDAGMDVLFKKDRADVLTADGSVILSFERQSGGLYVARLKLKKPSPGFVRQG